MGDRAKRPVSDEHALLVGQVWGTGIRHGLDLNPVVGEDGDWTDTLELVLHRNSEYAGLETHIYLVVAPPVPASV
jgi:hypothetical protein